MSRKSDRRSSISLAALALLIAGLLVVLRASNNSYARLLHRARMHADRLERAAAVATYRDAARLRPLDPRPHLELAHVYLSWGRCDEALDAVADAEQAGGEAAELERLRAPIHVRSAESATQQRTSHWEAVVDHGKRVLQFAPGDREARQMLARAYLELRQWGAAQSMYQELLRSDPTDPMVRERLGALLLGDDSIAFEHLHTSGTELSKQLLKAFESGLTVEEPAYVHTLAGRVLMEEQEWALATRQLVLAIRHHPDYADAHAYLGHALDQMGYREEAKSHLLKATTLAPTSAVAHTFLGLHHDRWGDTMAARVAYEMAYDLAPQNPAICVEIGQTWAAEGRYLAAEVWLQQAVSMRPDDPSLWMVLARFYLEHNITSNDRAVEAAERLLTLAPDSATAQDLRGWAALQTGRYQVAETHLQRAIALDPELASAHYHLGLLWNAQGRPHEAERAFQRAVDLDTTGTLLPLIDRVR